MNSCLYQGFITHTRISPRKHSFRYPLTLFCLDLDELEEIQNQFWEIGSQFPALFQFESKNYLPKKTSKSTKLKQKAIEVILSEKPSLKVEKVVVVTHLKMLGYLFNPATFYLFYNPDGESLAGMVEVTNTYGEVKNYIVSKDDKERLKACLPKCFYISPFSELENFLHIKLSELEKEVKFIVNEKKDGQYLFFSHFFGERKELSHPVLLKFFVKNAFNSYRITFLIHWQALLLWFKKVPYFPKKLFPEKQSGIYFKKKSSKSKRDC